MHSTYNSTWCVWQIQEDICRGGLVNKPCFVLDVIHENLKRQYGLSLITIKITRGSLILFSISISPHEKYASCFRGLSFCVRGRCDLEPLLLAHYIQWKIWQVFYESVLKVCYFHSPGTTILYSYVHNYHCDILLFLTSWSPAQRFN